MTDTASAPISNNPADGTATSALKLRARGLMRELAKFGTVGAFAFIIDVAVFNLILPLGKPLTAKVISVTVAATFAYFANRHWTWKDRARTGLGREYAMFFAVNGIGMLIAVSVLAFTHYVLGFTSPLADNISANGIGLVLGTLFRFWAYRTFVFKAEPAQAEVQPTV